MAIDNARSTRLMRQHMLHFTFNEAKKLTKKKNSSVVEVLHDMSLSMSPRFIGNINLGLKETLSKELLTYNEQLKGVPLAYNNIKIIDSHVIDDQDLFKLDIKLTFIVFKPQPGEFLDAVVNKTTDHHIGCVIHNCINSSVRQPKIDALTDEQKAVTENIEIGDTITFKVFRMDIHHGILFVLGDIIGPCYTRTGKIKQRDINNMNKNRAGYSTLINPSEDNNMNNIDDVSNDTIKQEAIEPVNDDDVEVVAEKSPRKKRKKKIKTEDDNSFDIENMGDRVVKIIEIKQEPLQEKEDEVPVEKSLEKEKKLNNLATTSESEGNMSTPTKKKRKRKKNQTTYTPSDSNNNDQSTVKEELSMNGTGVVKKSLKKKNTNELIATHNNEINESPRKKKHKHKDKTEDIQITQKIYSSDKDTTNPNEKNGVKQEEQTESENMKSPKKVKHNSKELVEVTNIESPSKKKRKKDTIKEEVVSENELAHSDQLMSAKKKKIKMTYTGS